MKKKYWPIMVCIGILFFFLCTILVRFGVRQILVKRMRMDNVITRIVLFDSPELRKSQGNKVDGDKVGNIEINWEEKYPFKDEDFVDKKKSATRQGVDIRVLNVMEKLSAKVKSVEKKVTEWTQRWLVGYKKLKLLGQKYSTVFDFNIPTYNIFRMSNGYYTYREQLRTKEEINDIAESVADFYKFLQKRNIGFLYVNAGSKVDPDKRELSLSMRKLENTNENGDSLQNELARREIPFIDMREKMRSAGLDWYRSYYKYDHHWKTETGLWAAGVIATELNKSYGFNYDMKYFLPESYQMETYDDIFFGGQAREVGDTTVKPESYTKILPKFNTKFEFVVPTRSICKNGKYEEMLFDSEQFEKTLLYTEKDYITEPDTYHSVGWRNDAIGVIKNLGTYNNSKRILFIQDSFAWYLTTYMATDTKEIHLMYPHGFTGSIRSYIEKHNPDMVIVIFCEKNILPIDWSGHNSFFDFR